MFDPKVMPCAGASRCGKAVGHLTHEVGIHPRTYRVVLDIHAQKQVADVLKSNGLVHPFSNPLAVEQAVPRDDRVSKIQLVQRHDDRLDLAIRLSARVQGRGDRTGGRPRDVLRTNGCFVEGPDDTEMQKTPYSAATERDADRRVRGIASGELALHPVEIECL